MKLYTAFVLEIIYIDMAFQSYITPNQQLDMACQRRPKPGIKLDMPCIN